MNKKYNQHILTKKQEENFERDGFIIVENVLSKDKIEELLFSVDKIWKKHHSKNPDHYLHTFDFFNKNKIFIELIDCKKTLPIVLGLLGWNIYMYHAHLDINLPIKSENSPDMTWHRDNSRMNYDFKDGKYPLVALKIGYWLGDVSAEDRGNLYIIPGSHKWDFTRSKMIRNDKLPREAIPIKVKPGTIVIFDTRTWHSRSNNFSKVTRKVIFIGYAYRWLRPGDNVKVSFSILQKANKIQRQLLNRNIDSSAYVPKEEDVPLKELYYKLYQNKEHKQDR